ncbi:MAG: hypothetical protein U0794_21775 [Isosphaeraceae bacterium]
MSSLRSPASILPSLPLLLGETPPGLELILCARRVLRLQVARDPHPHRLQARTLRPLRWQARFLGDPPGLADSRHIPIDVDRLRAASVVDFSEGAGRHALDAARWELQGYSVHERIARHDWPRPGEQILGPLRPPWPRRAASGHGSLRSPSRTVRRSTSGRISTRTTSRTTVDRARARRRLEDCCTHFVSTAAYGESPAILQDLLRFDTQSHGHHHFVYRDAASNRRNLIRAHEVLCDSGFEPLGFAAPHGRWNVGLDQVIEELGYLYSSDFQLGYDDVPFFPWCGDRFSRVLQVPIHPVCEGVFFEAGATRGRSIAEHLTQVVRARIESGEPAFVYGHPERRLARHPEVLAALDAAITGESLVWRVTLHGIRRSGGTGGTSAGGRSFRRRRPLRGSVRGLVPALPPRPRGRSGRSCREPSDPGVRHAAPSSAPGL